KLAERDRAALELRRTTITAPIGGIAVNVRLQPGDQLKPATPIFVIVAATRPWVEANMKETDLTHVVPGQKASVVLDIYPDIAWEAEVESISPATGAEFGKGALFRSDLNQDQVIEPGVDIAADRFEVTIG